MAQLYSTGPAHIYIGSASVGGGPGSATYFGTCERKPRIQIRPNYKPVFNDLGGEVPFDLSYQGEDAVIALEMTRYNEAVYATQIAARPRNGQGGVGPFFPRGTDGPLDTGSLIVTENMGITLWVLFPFSAKAAFGTQPAGYRFFNTVPIGPDDLENLGTQARKLILVFQALRFFSPKTGTMITYDHNVAACGAIN